MIFHFNCKCKCLHQTTDHICKAFFPSVHALLMECLHFWPAPITGSMRSLLLNYVKKYKFLGDPQILKEKQRN